MSINRFPEGLLAVLDYKSRGETPRDLSTTVLPTIDMLPYYELGQGLEWRQSSGTLSAGNAVAPLVVPAGEVWLLRLATLKIEALAGGTVSAYLAGSPTTLSGAQLPLAAMGPGFGSYNFSPGAAGVSCILTYEPSSALFLRAGWQFNAYTDVAAGGGFTALISVLVTRYAT